MEIRVEGKKNRGNMCAPIDTQELNVREGYINGTEMHQYEEVLEGEEKIITMFLDSHDHARTYKFSRCN